jgi:branched-chain amino acid aminotransferase
MESELACIDGRLVATAQAVIPVTDRGLIRGDGAFEVIPLYAGRPYALDAHLARLERSAAGLRLAVDVDAIRADVATLLATRDGEDELLRIVCTRGGRRILLIEPMPDLPQSLALEPVTYAPTRVLDGIKSLSYAANMLATRLACEQGADEALLVSPHGRVLECPTASFFLVRGGVIQTPPLSDHILDSITRRVVLTLAVVREEPIELAALAGAQEAFVVSSGHGLVAVHRIGEHAYAAPGPRTRELGALVHERIRAELA